MSIPFTYISISNGSSTWKIPTAVGSGVSGTQNNIMCISSNGLLTIGDNTNEAVERTFSNGSVLPPYARFGGKDFNVDFVIYSLNRNINIKQIFINFQNLLKANRLTITTDFPVSLTAQLQRIDLVSEDWKGKGRVHLRVYFKSEEP